MLSGQHCAQPCQHSSRSFGQSVQPRYHLLSVSPGCVKRIEQIRASALAVNASIDTIMVTSEAIQKVHAGGSHATAGMHAARPGRACTFLRLSRPLPTAISARTPSIEPLILCCEDMHMRVSTGQVLMRLWCLPLRHVHAATAFAHFEMRCR